MTNGSSTTVSRTLLSGHSLRANSHASAMPNGRINNVLASPTASEKSVICQVSNEKITKRRNLRSIAGGQFSAGSLLILRSSLRSISIQYDKAVFLESGFRGGTLNIVQEVVCHALVLRFLHNRDRISDLGTLVDGHFVDDFHFLRNGGV